MKKMFQRLLALALVLFVFVSAPQAEAASSVKLNKTSASVFVSRATQLKVTGTSKKVTWTSSNQNVASVSASGVVTGRAPGSAVITAAVGSKKYTCKVTVKAALKTDKESLSLTDKAQYINVTLDKAKETVMYKVQNSKIATCAFEGNWKKNTIKLKVTPRKTGTTYITLSNTYTAEKIIIKVNVKKDVPVSSLTMDKKNASIYVGKTTTLTATVKPANATDSLLTWSTSNKNVAKVNAYGVVTGVSAGTATISAKTQDGKFKAECVVTVQNPVSFQSQKMPVEVNDYENGAVAQTVKLTSAGFKIVSFDSDDIAAAEFTLSGIKTYDAQGKDVQRGAVIGWTLTDEDTGNVVAQGEVTTPAMTQGESFADVKISVDGLPMGSYVLRFANAGQ